MFDRHFSADVQAIAKIFLDARPIELFAVADGTGVATHAHFPRGGQAPPPVLSRLGQARAPVLHRDYGTLIGVWPAAFNCSFTAAMPFAFNSVQACTAFSAGVSQMARASALQVFVRNRR